MKQGLYLMRKCRNLNKNWMARSLSNAPPEVDTGVSTETEKASAGKHLKFTATSPRQPVVATAVVTEVRLESPAVRGITLQVDNPDFSFKAGQWIDMFIPGIETIGGFSMYSSPNQLAEKGTLELGIKFSKWPPAFWIHDQEVLDTISSNNPNMEVQYFTTRSMPPKSSNAKYGHITQEDLKSAVESLDLSVLKTFICGPPPMIEKVNENLLAIGLAQNQLIYEKWW
ncbi:oxidoreductase NAD-binding domain-containing protein 1-like isoform X2 [Penaeus chinensis]|uniref:oxidoreductase NAD-binding domain-containing protein 1-like isoform X2 n=1 Tax=Penaeus chinensis TaxID=139456 RepID=UPI001FB6E18D|nr:oxidoreductase NAD-binding domain-containing protein 1-like isoform X2 [Penaeus chinensis]